LAGSVYNLNSSTPSKFHLSTVGSTSPFPAVFSGPQENFLEELGPSLLSGRMSCFPSATRRDARTCRSIYLIVPLSSFFRENISSSTKDTPLIKRSSFPPIGVPCSPFLAVFYYFCCLLVMGLVAAPMSSPLDRTIRRTRGSLISVIPFLLLRCLYRAGLCRQRALLY